MKLNKMSGFSIPSFLPISKQDVGVSTSIRDGEVKLGQVVKVFEDFDGFTGRYVIIGVREDVGPRANFGLQGARNGFDAFFKRFLNVQSNRFFSGDQVLMYGVVDFNVESGDTVELRNGVGDLDDLLNKHLIRIYSKGCVPILIGGGHNNAFPLMKSFFLATNNKLNVINCDPHADFRLLEGRHSGNSFSYAKELGFISRYSVLGLHQSYNSEEMLSRMESEGCFFTFFEDYLHGSRRLDSDIKEVLNKYGSDFVGVELDMDAIIGMPSSAFTPSGFLLEEARRYVTLCGGLSNAIYLHLPEGAPKNDVESSVVGKSLVYLVMDFMKASLFF